MVHLADGGVLGEQQAVESSHVGDIAQEDHRPGDHAVREQGDAMQQHDHVGPPLHLFDHRPSVGQGPVDRRLLDVEVTEAPPLRGA